MVNTTFYTNAPPLSDIDRQTIEKLQKSAAGVDCMNLSDGVKARICSLITSGENSTSTRFADVEENGEVTFSGKNIREIPENSYLEFLNDNNFDVFLDNISK